MNRILRLAVSKAHRDPAGLVYRVYFKATGVHRQGIQPVNRLPSQFVAAYAAKNGGMIAQLPGHHSEVCRRSA